MKGIKMESDKVEFVTDKEKIADLRSAADELEKRQINPVIMDFDDFIDAFTEGMDFDTVRNWCVTLGVEVNEPATDDMWPDWENELRVELGDAMAKVGK